MIDTAELYFFSPTGGTKKVGGNFCREIAENVLLSDLIVRDQDIIQPMGELTVVAAPVFGGRIPTIVADM